MTDYSKANIESLKRYYVGAIMNHMDDEYLGEIIAELSNRGINLEQFLVSVNELRMEFREQKRKQKSDDEYWGNQYD